jgi:hypothetical protein
MQGTAFKPEDLPQLIQWDVEARRWGCRIRVVELDGLEEAAVLVQNGWPVWCLWRRLSSGRLVGEWLLGSSMFLCDTITEAREQIAGRNAKITSGISRISDR